MAHRMYPLPDYETEVPAGVPPIRATRSMYAPVSASSPIFVLDCEMCLTPGNVSELTRITMVRALSKIKKILIYSFFKLNEDGKTVLDTLVKPTNEIIDYVTCFSGITPELLAGCSTTLDDVQRALERILPPDAIIAGHSIENDLRALRLSHPYGVFSKF